MCSESSSQTVVVKKNQSAVKNCAVTSWSGTDKRRKLCKGHSQRVRVPVPERSRRRGDGGTGVDTGADGHHPPRDTVFIDADAPSPSEQLASYICSVPTEQLKPGPPEVKEEVRA